MAVFTQYLIIQAIKDIKEILKDDNEKFDN